MREDLISVTIKISGTEVKEPEMIDLIAEEEDSVVDKLVDLVDEGIQTAYLSTNFGYAAIIDSIEPELILNLFDFKELLESITSQHELVKLAVAVEKSDMELDRSFSDLLVETLRQNTPSEITYLTYPNDEEGNKSTAYYFLQEVGFTNAYFYTDWTGLGKDILKKDFYYMVLFELEGNVYWQATDLDREDFEGPFHNSSYSFKDFWESINEFKKQIRKTDFSNNKRLRSELNDVAQKMELLLREPDRMRDECEDIYGRDDFALYGELDYDLLMDNFDYDSFLEEYFGNLPGDDPIYEIFIHDSEKHREGLSEILFHAWVREVPD